MIKSTAAFRGVISYVSLIVLFSCCQIANATSGRLFNVTLSGATLTITPVYNPQAPNKLYEHAGVKITTPGFSVSQCTPLNNGFCSFPTSSNDPASIAVSGPSGIATVRVCLNATGQTATCENHQIDAPHIIFITQDGYSGNLGGVAGADVKCNDQAYMSGSTIPPGRTFQALLVSSTRYPCSNPSGNDAGACGDSFVGNWPLIPGTVYYQPNGESIFNKVNENGVFDGEIVALQSAAGDASVAQFWSGVQSVHSTPDGLHIDAWAFADMNPNADQSVYKANLAHCQNWTSSMSSVHGSVGSAGRFQGNLLGPVLQSTWGNYYYFSDDTVNYLFNLFSISAYYNCDGPASLVCVG